jgi:hypothetical protein
MNLATFRSQNEPTDSADEAKFLVQAKKSVAAFAKKDSKLYGVNDIKWRNSANADIGMWNAAAKILDGGAKRLWIFSDGTMDQKLADAITNLGGTVIKYAW